MLFKLMLFKLISIALNSEQTTMGRIYTVSLLTLFTIIIVIIVQTNANESRSLFDVRNHLSTVSRYGIAKDVAAYSFVPSNVPEGCTPIHLNLVARHGTRSPTKKRIKELDTMATRIDVLFKDGRALGEKVPAWLRKWESPWKGKGKDGELLMLGEDELYNLGLRVRARFPDLFKEDYHPDIYNIKATQVPRVSASAVAFGMGLFSGQGKLGPGRHRAFAVTSESRASDIMLSFHGCCKNYKAFRKSQDPSVHKLKEPTLDEITSALSRRYGLNFTRQDTSSLWFLCKQEASLLDITSQACELFTPFEVELLEWTDDLEGFILNGYGKSINYRMGVPLLEDVVQSMDQAINAREEGHPPGSYEKARLRFAHAETLAPFSCLLGLFLEGPEFERIQKEQPLEYPPKPPQRRNWRGNTVAPFAGNNMLVLYSCPADTSSNYFVQVLHNEHPIPMPGCRGLDFCPLKEFKEKIVAPHLKHDYNSVCNVKSEQQDDTPDDTSKFSRFFRWLFPLKNNDESSHKYDL